MKALLSFHILCILITTCYAEAPSKTYTLRISHADTPQKQTMGYMHQSSIADDEGLLFVFTHVKHLCFWMKNTLVPLDILLLDDSHTVIETMYDLQPRDLKSRCFKTKGRRALELKARTHKIRVGDRIQQSVQIAP